ncbi:PKD domain-containing protein [Pontibacter beigongshangensis]|uniref:PKD domain-containing protein n=1 Tax=Pontibacter beigongshangensis TaxID=2574733 RepID=UPI0016506FA3|nr:PKD domain-containing protein [Pontibacter beigongshangensis]
MRYIAIIWFALCGAIPAFGQIDRMEYFVDTDPGIGNATALNITPGNSISQEFTVALANQASGHRVIYVRARDTQKRWSHTQAHSFYVIMDEASAITATEYFIGTDPGPGNATPLTATAGADGYIRFVVPLTTAPTGFHTLSIRSKDDQGNWSHTQQHSFYIRNVEGSPNIVAVKYDFTSNAVTYEPKTHRVLKPDTPVDEEFAADLSDLTENQEYDMRVWAVNGEGVRSEMVTKRIKVCANEPVIANFEFNQAGAQVSFLSSSIGVSNYKWDFGDGTPIVTDPNPTHTYTASGLYSIKLIVENDCNSDTLVKEVNMNALSVQPALTADSLRLICYPNPVENEALLEFQVPVAQQVSIILHDMVGRKTLVVTNKRFQPGKNHVRLSLKEFQAGIYICEIQGESSMKSIRVLKL